MGTIVKNSENLQKNYKNVTTSLIMRVLYKRSDLYRES